MWETEDEDEDETIESIRNKLHKLKVNQRQNAAHNKNMEDQLKFIIRTINASADKFDTLVKKVDVSKKNFDILKKEGDVIKEQERNMKINNIAGK